MQDKWLNKPGTAAAKEKPVMRASVMNLKLKKAQIAASILGKVSKDEGGDGKRISIKRDSVKYSGAGGDVEELRIENDRL
jgi:hypothetical protein